MKRAETEKNGARKTTCKLADVVAHNFYKLKIQKMFKEKISQICESAVSSQTKLYFYVSIRLYLIHMP